MVDEAVAQGRLLPVLMPWHPPPAEVFALYPSSRYLTLKVRAFVDLALEKFPRSRSSSSVPG